MGWNYTSLESALVGLRDELDNDQACEEVAIVWRGENEYGIVPGWIVRNFGQQLDWDRLKVVMFLNRTEYELLMSMIKEGIG